VNVTEGLPWPACFAYLVPIVVEQATKARISVAAFAAHFEIAGPRNARIADARLLSGLLLRRP
jgi:hypothetical protein